jgi:N-acetylmuramoyl-L-alanine amidase
MISHQFKADQIHHSTMSKTPRQIEWILLHSSEGTNSLGWLTTDSPPPNNVSAHALINRIGHRYHLVDPQDVAYHAGVCRWGITNYNSLGIEIENKSELGTGVHEDYPTIQLATTAHLLAGFMYSFGVDRDHIVYHRDIAMPRGRRTDPDFFPEDLFWPLVTEYYSYFRRLSPDQLLQYLY